MVVSKCKNNIFPVQCRDWRRIILLLSSVSGVWHFYGFETALCGGKSVILPLVRTMACILNIETSGCDCSVALSDGLQTVWSEECSARGCHAERLPVFVENALYHLRREGKRLDGVAVSSGPGSYTGLRIGVSTAKGVCYGLGVKLLAVPTLEALCVPVLLEREIADGELLCPMLDARRMEVYSAVFDTRLHAVRDTVAEIIDRTSYADLLEKRVVYFFGDGAEKCKSVIRHANARFIDGIRPLARNMQPLSDKRFHAGDFADVAYFAPNYLKDFRAGQPKPLL